MGEDSNKNIVVKWSGLLIPRAAFWFQFPDASVFSLSGAGSGAKREFLMLWES